MTICFIRSNALHCHILIIRIKVIIIIIIIIITIIIINVVYFIKTNPYFHQNIENFPCNSGVFFLTEQLFSQCSQRSRVLCNHSAIHIP